MKAGFWGKDFLIVSVGWVCYQESEQVFVDFLDKNLLHCRKLNLSVS